MLIKNPPVAITERLWMLGTAAYPLYLYTGDDEAAIFEGGTGSMGPVLREQLNSLGIDAAIVKQAIITHAHPDHVMAIPLFREMFPGITVIASEEATSTLAMEKAVSFFCKVDDAFTRSLLKVGVIRQQHRRPPLKQKTIAVDRAVRDGDEVTVDGTSFTVLATPGHSICSLSFHEPTQRILLISDATGYYLPEQDTWWPCYFTGYGAYVDSMRRLAERGAEILCLSHNAVVRGADAVKDYFDRAIANTEQYHRRIVEEVKGSKPLRELAEQLGAEVYEQTQLLPIDFFQKNCGLLVKQSLRHEGIAEEG